MLRHFFSYLENQIEKDQEITDIYNDVFLEFQPYSRQNLHQSIND